MIFRTLKLNISHILGFVLFSSALLAQGFYFGRNKIQYTDFDWQVMQTEHFDIYYYPEMIDVARQGAEYAEKTFRALEPKFNHSITRRIPLIFYSSHLHSYVLLQDQQDTA